MKKLLLLFLFIVTASVSFQAKAFIIYSYGEVVNVEKRLPVDSEINGTHVNLAVIYDQFDLFWLPVWNYGTPRYILLADNEKDYWETDEETLEQLKADFNIAIPDEPAPSLWNKIGLKPVLAILIICIIWSMLAPKKEDEENHTMDDNHTNPYKTT